VRTLDPDEASSLKTLALCGEAPTKDAADTWLGRVRLLNVYGPSETSVVVATHQIMPSGASPRTIGRGCNARLWIVDPDNQARLAAVGCVGELVVQGPGIARGYLNDQARTSQAFIESPMWLPSSSFQRVYRTGDLVRYNTDGTIEYVGRADTQLKLRGQRLESGEIEYHIKRLLPIAQHVAVTKSQVSSQDALVAFICIATHSDSPAAFGLLPVDDGFLQTFVALSEELSAHLPSYMVPSYFLPITAMPVTATGKLDTKLLDKTLSDMTADELRQYSAAQKALAFQEPTNETETHLRRLFAQASGSEESAISVADSLRHLGTDSLSLVTIQGAIKKAFGKTLSVQFLNGQGMSIRKLAPHVQEETSAHADRDLPPMEDLGKVFEPSVQQALPPNLGKWEQETSRTLQPGVTILLTGGTGYLGSAILHHLLSDVRVEKVAVLVRARSKDHALDRVVRSARIAGWWSEIYLAKLAVWKGDLGMRGFGLAHQEWKALNGQLSPAENVDAIIHNGAAVGWSADFKTLKAVNVDSTLQLLSIAFASPAHPKIVYVSGGGLVDQDEDRVVAARSLASYGIGYSQTKVISELVIRECATRLPPGQTMLSTIKPGLIIGTPDQGVANTDDLLWRIVSAAARTRAYPQEPSNHRMRIDDTDSIVRRIIRQLFSVPGWTSEVEAVKNGGWNSYAPITTDISIPDFWRVIAESLGDAGVNLKPVSWDEWLLTVRRDLESEKERHILWPVQSFLGGLGTVSERDGSEREGDGTPKRLEAALRKNVEYLTASGFFDGSGTEGHNMSKEVLKRRGL
jgi:thioester reductase-like protein